MARHNCPDCKCEPVCDLCNGWGYVQRSEKTAEWEGPNGEPQASWTMTMEPCPNGCIAMAFYSTGTTSYSGLDGL